MTTDIIPGEARDVTPLSGDEKRALKVAESHIERGMRSFVDVGNALAEIRDSRLYRATHATFEAYVQERWHWERRTAYDYIGAAVVQENVRSTAQLPSVSHGILLAPFEPERQAELAPLIASLTQREARDFIRTLDDDRQPAERVKAVQELVGEEQENTKFVAFRNAAGALDITQLTVEELVEFVGIIQKLAASYKAEKARRG